MTAEAWRDVDREVLCPRCHRLVSLQAAGDDVRLAEHPDRTGPCPGSQLAVALNAPLNAPLNARPHVLQAILACCEEALAGEATDWNEGLRQVKALVESHTLQGRPRVERLFAAALRNQQPEEDPVHPDHDPDRLPESPRFEEGPSAPARQSAPGPSSPASPEDEGGGRPDPTP